MKHIILSALLIMAVCPGLPASAFAQAAGVTIFDDDALLEQIAEKGKKLLDAKKLAPLSKYIKQLSRSRCQLELAPARSRKLDGPAVCDIARRSTLAVGLLLKDPESGEWYFNAATGFVIAPNGVIATCYHVLHNEEEHTPPKKEHHKKDGEQKADQSTEGKRDSGSSPESKLPPRTTDQDVNPDESYLLAADFEGHVFPVLEVLAADKIADTCILRIQATGLEPLPLNPETRPGETVYCFSNPSDMFGHFSQGIIARFFVIREGEDTSAEPGILGNTGKPNKAGRPVCFLSVTSDYAVGSSGGPILDDRGNVVGQVQSTSSIFADAEADDPKHPQMVVKAALAVREILALIEPPKPKMLVINGGTGVEPISTRIPPAGITVTTVAATGEVGQGSAADKPVQLTRIALHLKQIQDDYESESAKLLTQIESARMEEHLAELNGRVALLIARTEKRCLRLVNAAPSDPAVLPALEYLVLHSEQYQRRALDLIFQHHAGSPEIGKTCVYFMDDQRGPHIPLVQIEKLTRAVIKQNCHHEAVGLATLTLAEVLRFQARTADSSSESAAQRIHETQKLLVRVVQHFSKVRIPSSSKRSENLAMSSDFAGPTAETELKLLHEMTRLDIEHQLKGKFFFDRSR
ncbi:MAG: Trypsin-like protein serine protease typically periplasmic containing C-terminal domain [Planctomycetaceae bacterium]|nr:Trypsin-like protein serine protease typically periplasmic containing C-terminal domain [Planctomycetaceae bacterium]